MSKLASLRISIFSIYKKAALKPITMLELLSFLCFGLLHACAPPPSPPTITYEPTRPAKEIVVDDDRTGSVKDWVYDSGLQLAVRNLASVIHTGQGSITIIVRQIDHDSHVPEARLVIGRIDAVKPMPLQPVLPPFLDPAVRKQIMTQYANQKREAEASLKQAQAEANQLETQILHHDSRHVPIDPQWGTDVMGSWIAASGSGSCEKDSLV